MKKFFSLVLALVMALSLTTVAWGATLQDAIDAAVDGTATTITLDADTTESIVIPAGKVIVLDLNGKTLSYTSTAAAASRAIDNKGTLTIKNGTVTYAGVGDPNFGYGTNTINNTGKLTIDGATIINTTDSGSSVAIDCAAGAELIVNSGEIKSEKNAIRLCPFGAAAINCTINGGTITGARAIQIQLPSNNPASAPDINLTVTGGTLNGTSGLSIYSYSAGQGVDNVDITLSGGVYNNDVAFGGGNAKTTQENVTVTGGTFNSGFYTYNDTIDDEITISGGTFATDVSEYVVDGMQLLANGTVVPTPAASATDPVLYVADNSTAGWATYCIATGADLDDLKQGADENCLPCYLINGDYYTEVSPAIAIYKLAYGAKTVYLNPVDSTDVCYDAEAKVFTNITKKTDECGKLVVTDTTKTYYVFYDELDDDEDYYFVATKNGSIQLLVNGKIVDVELHTVQALTAHKWFGYDVVNNAYTTIKCENCEKVAKLYANKTAAGKNAVYVDNFGWITAADAVLPGTVVTPSTDKVESAETFDAGIAMYVGMSVMAAASSAVVIGKKKD